MLDAVKKQWKVLRRDWIWGYFVTLGAGLAGMIVMTIIMWGDPEVETYFTMGTMMGCIATSVFILILTGMGFYTSFSLEVGFGCTRKRFFVSYYLVSLVRSLLDIPLLAGICVLEQALYSRWYAGCSNEVEMLPWLPLVGGALSLGLPLAGILAALLIMRFGRPACWALCLVWMGGFVLIPNLLDAAKDAPASAYGWAGRQILRLAGLFSAPQWVGIGIAAGAACLWIAYRLARKQQVNG